MTLDRKDYESSIPQLEKRIKALEKKVTVTTLFPTAFQLLPQTPHVRFHE